VSTTASFPDRFAAARAKFGPLTFGLDPSGDLLRRWGLEDTPDGVERFVDIALAASAGTVGVVKPQSAFYERHGWRGVRALDRLVSEARSDGVLVLLDVKRGDVGSTNTAYAEAYLAPGAPIAADAITVTAYLGFDALEPFFAAAATAGGAGVFVVTRSSNPDGRPLQESVGANGKAVEVALLDALAARNRAVAPDGVGPFGSVFAANHGPPSGTDLRSMGGLFLAPGLGTQGASPADVAACFASCPDRVLPSASRSLLDVGPDVGRLRDAVSDLASALNDSLRA
jgi:orotidine-5'-phosphate decarboxylase